MPPIDNVLEPARDVPNAPAQPEKSEYLKELAKRADAGGHGVSLGDMSPEEICGRLLGD